MSTITRKQIEEYYEKEWTDHLPFKALKILIELTCQAYKLNEPPLPNFVKEKELPRPQDLGQI